MANYTDADLQGEWEFKIVRSNTAAFRNPEVLRQVCAEEAEAGWVLLEKFDNQRLRFKRPVSARAGDTLRRFDPYRTYYGISGGALAATIIAVALSVTIGLFGLLILLVKK